jgi:hypothetical protein
LVELQTMSDQRQIITQAFSAAVPEVGMPEIFIDVGGAYTARASRDGVNVDVRRTVAGEVTAQVTTSGPNAGRGVATANSAGSESSQMVFGPEGDKAPQFAASRLARTLAQQ